MHTSEVSRKLVTGSKLDVQFSDLNAQYAFGFAAFDNARPLDEPLDLEEIAAIEAAIGRGRSERDARSAGL